MTDEQWELLVLSLGLATGACQRDGMKELAGKIHALFQSLQSATRFIEPFHLTENKT